MKYRVVYKADGSISIIYPSLKSKRPDETESSWLDRIFTMTMNKRPDLVGMDFDDFDELVLPNEEFRGAWRGEKGKPIVIDSDAKKDIEYDNMIREEINAENKSKRDRVIEKLKSEGKLPDNF